MIFIDTTNIICLKLLSKFAIKKIWKILLKRKYLINKIQSEFEAVPQYYL
jgi:hypothetical protein